MVKINNTNGSSGKKPKTPAKQVHKRTAKSAGVAKPSARSAKPAAGKPRSSSRATGTTGATRKVAAARKTNTQTAPSARQRTTGKNPKVSATPVSRKAPNTGKAGATKKVAAVQNKLPVGKASSLLQEAKAKVASAKPASTAPRGPQQRTGSKTQTVAGLFEKHFKIMVPVTLVLVFFLGFGVIDLVGSWGKIHKGVTVEGVDVGGLTVEQASDKLNEQLSPVVQSMSITAYKNADIASKDGVDLNAVNVSGTNVAYADENESTGVAAGSDVDKDGEADKWRINANTIGAYLDTNALANAAFAYGREGNFIGDRMAGYFSTKNYQATISYNHEFYNDLTNEINAEIGTAITNSTFKVSDGKAVLAAGQDGNLVDESPFVTNMSRAVFNSNAPYCVIPMHTVTRYVSDETAQKVVDQVNNAISQPVTVTYEGETWTLDSAGLGSLIGKTVLQPGQIIEFGQSTQNVVQGEAKASKYDISVGTDPNSNYALQAYVDQAAFDQYLVGVLGDKAVGGATSAYFDTSDGETVHVVDSVEGNGPDRATAELSLQNILFGNGKPLVSTTDNAGKTEITEARDTSRNIELQNTVIEPEVTTEEANAMGITERLATWSIPLSGTSARINNIQLLCKMIDKSLIAPGQVWSFNGTTGERTEEKGFDKAATIINGKHEDQLGGGVCQVATCVYNAACFSGLGIENRVNHDFYIAAYDDEGFADATVSWESPDFAFKNDMSTYVYMTADASSEDVVVSLWGTKDGRTVKCERGEWKEGDKYVQITEQNPDMPAGTTAITQTGQDGRKIDIRYLVTSATGEVLHDILFHSYYSAQNEITSVGTGPA